MGQLPIHHKVCLLSFLDPVEWNALRLAQWTLEELDAKLAWVFANPLWMNYKLPTRTPLSLFQQCYHEYVRVTPGHPGGPPPPGSFASFRAKGPNLRSNSGSFYLLHQ